MTPAAFVIANAVALFGLFWFALGVLVGAFGFW